MMIKWVSWNKTETDADAIRLNCGLECSRDANILYLSTRGTARNHRISRHKSSLKRKEKERRQIQKNARHE